jgi:putative tryptophan/tyrosine transport system substrate-binding protein
MRRREFITLLGSAVTWPLAARAQQSAMPMVGFLGTASAGPFAHLLASLRRGLQETGFIEGRNVARASSNYGTSLVKVCASPFREAS